MAALLGADTSRRIRYVPARLYQPRNLIKSCNPVAQDLWCRLDRGHHASLRSVSQDLRRRAHGAPLYSLYRCYSVSTDSHEHLQLIAVYRMAAIAPLRSTRIVRGEQCVRPAHDEER
jgi:hypothetical protein